MESKDDGLARFLRLFQSFQCQRIPSDLWIRACEPRPTWSKTGEIIKRPPLEAGVPEWLLEFYDSNMFLFHGTELEQHNGYVKTIMEHGVAYLEATNEGYPILEVAQSPSFVDERMLAQERIAIILQAFPSINTEILGEEISDRLMDVVKTSILPLLSSLTDADIEGWLLPQSPEEREPLLVSLLEFLCQVIDLLGIANPLIPLPLLRQISKVISNDTIANCSIVWGGIPQILDTYLSSGSDIFQSAVLSSEAKTNQRSNALVGHILAMMLSNESLLTEPKLPVQMLDQALSDWQPLSLSSPSTMEYLAVTSFCSRSQLDMIRKPSFVTVDVMALRGLLLSRRKQHKDAAKVLESTMVGITSQYGLCSMQLGIVTAELANCYNISRQEGKAEDCLRTAIQARQDRGLSIRRDFIYLRLSLADSFIGRARYSEAVPILQSIIDNHDIPSTLRMMSVLRLARSRRRMHEDTQKAFEENSPLWAGFAILGHVPEALTTEYVEELACNISEIPKRQQGDSQKIQELIEAVNSALCSSISLTDSPCWEWYTKIQQQYFGQITEAATNNKGKQIDKEMKDENEQEESVQSEERNDIGIFNPFQVFDDLEPWSEKLVLSFGINLSPSTDCLIPDGGGVRAISSLFILKHIMHRIRELELIHPDGPAYSSSQSSWTRDGSGSLRALEESDRVDEYLPCHYFDYVAGTSTGGLNGIMIGRLGMSVDQAIDKFIDFGNAVFGHSRDFNAASDHNNSRAKYSAARASSTLQNILSNNNHVAMEDSANPLDIVQKTHDTFSEYGCRTKTMIISCRNNDGAAGAHIWRSYGNAGNSATIWEVARATSANPVYFDPIEINGVTHVDGGLVANNPSFEVLQEVYLDCYYAPAVFVAIGTGVEIKAIPKNVSKWRDFPGLQKLHKYSQHIKAPRHSDKEELFTENVVKRWLELAPQRAYRLDAEGDLHEMPFDDWRPAGTGKTTLQEIADITNDYLREDEVRYVILRIAKQAVRIRRERAATPRWKDFAQDRRLR